jgi:glycosyltransferase involved in cell wall biosynthesis
MPFPKETHFLRVMSNNNFSFIVACYNTGEYLEECLISLIAQVYSKEAFEIVVVNDGSTDNSPEILAQYQQSTLNLKVVHQENQGLEAACNSGITNASSKWMVRMDADDIADPNLLNALNQAMQSQPRADFFYCGTYYEFFSQAKKTLKTVPGFDKEEIFCRGDFFASGTAYQKDQLKEIGLYPTNEKNCGLENYNVTLKLLTKGYIGVPVSDAIFHYRRHASNMSKVKLGSIIEYGKKLLEQYNREFQTNEFHPYSLILD